MSAPDWNARDRALERALDLEGAERVAFLAGLEVDLRAAVDRLLVDALADDPLLDHRDERLALLMQGLGTVVVDEQRASAGGYAQQ